MNLHVLIDLKEDHEKLPIVKICQSRYTWAKMYNCQSTENRSSMWFVYRVRLGVFIMAVTAAKVC